MFFSVRHTLTWLPTHPAPEWDEMVDFQTVTRHLQHQHSDLGTRLTSVARECKEILLVDPDPDGLGAVQAALRLVANVETCSEFRAARARLLARPPDLLVTNLRLEAYNGLHLLHLARTTTTRCIAYAENHDPALAREVQEAGGFYEPWNRLPTALAGYVRATLPPHDRRSPLMDDQQQILRGRRCTDKRSAEMRQFLQ